ncbi:MAG: hypothetical protein AAF585_21275 [Verrucomicrobiota bacterium]
MKTTIVSISALLCALAGADTKPDSAHKFDELFALIKPEPGESRWMEIDWHPGIWEGRQLAAKEGKPIFFMAGSGGAPCAGC